MADEIAQQVKHLSGNHEALRWTTQNSCKVRNGSAQAHTNALSVNWEVETEESLGARGTASLRHMVTNTKPYLKQAGKQEPTPRLFSDLWHTGTRTQTHICKDKKMHIFYQLEPKNTEDLCDCSNLLTLSKMASQHLESLVSKKLYVSGGLLTYSITESSILDSKGFVMLKFLNFTVILIKYNYILINCN